MKNIAIFLYYRQASQLSREPTPSRGVGHYINCDLGGQGFKYCRFKYCLPSSCLNMRFILNPYGCVVHLSGGLVSITIKKEKKRKVKQSRSHKQGPVSTWPFIIANQYDVSIKFISQFSNWVGWKLCRYRSRAPCLIRIRKLQLLTVRRGQLISQRSLQLLSSHGRETGAWLWPVAHIKRKPRHVVRSTRTN